MQTYANALLIAIPIFLVMILVEAVYGAVKGRQTFNSFDTLSSLSSAMTSAIRDSLGLVLVIVSYPFLLEHLALWRLGEQWWVYALAFLAVDFASYWSHRLNHRVNFFWNTHVIHHSSEEFNLACGLRQSISNVIGVYSIFLLPAALAGVPVAVIHLVAPVHLFLQGWYHTRHVPKLGWLEKIIITPSQHRVHHAINSEYLDKNLGQFFTWWDRLFGTFQEELDDVPPVYGLTRPARTWNPVKINFQHFWLLMQDAWRTRHLIDKLRIWWMPTGWRPADVVQRYPVARIDDPYRFEKYNTTRPTTRLLALAWLHVATTIALLLFMLASFDRLGTRSLMAYGFFLYLAIYGYTEMMDRSRTGVWIEVARGLLGLAFVVRTGGFFGLEQWLPAAELCMAGYFLVTVAGALLCGDLQPRPSADTAPSTA